MKRRPLIACVGSFALAGCLDSVPGIDSEDGGLRIVGIRHDDSSDYEGWAKDYKFENVVIENTADSEIDLDGKILQYDDAHSVSLPDVQLESRAVLIMLSPEKGSSRLQRIPPVLVRSAGFEDPETVLESPGTVTLIDENGDTIYQQEY